MKYTKMLVLFLVILLSVGSVRAAAAEKAEWYWLSSDAKYSKFFAPARVHVVTSIDNVPTQIEAWTKTNYSYAGAKETIDNYGIAAQIPDPETLSYSLARVEINPQNRTIEYAQEIFYDANDKPIWSKDYAKRTVKEINSQSFDEDFYNNIVDQVFSQGEVDRKNAADRWLLLWQASSVDGANTSCFADTTTIRQHGDNTIIWSWEETRNAAGAVTEIKFNKKTYNLPQETEKVIASSYWNAAKGWSDLSSELDGHYYSIVPDTNEDVGAGVLRAYIENNKAWVNRYAIK
ncbi:MAG: hypothetical protein WCS30_05420 [Selenomonadaceae bacterium]